MNKWEFRMETFQGDKITFTPWLNKQGKEGWELVTYSLSSSNGFYFFHCMFKRQLMKFVRPDRANNDQLNTMLIGICNLLEAKTIDRTIDAVPNLRKWWTSNRPGKKTRPKMAVELETKQKRVTKKEMARYNA